MLDIDVNRENKQVMCYQTFTPFKNKISYDSICFVYIKIFKLCS